MASQKTECTIAFEGMPGAHSEGALIELFRTQPSFEKLNPLPIGVPTFEKVCESVKNGIAELGFLPIESSIAGTLFKSIDLVEQYQLHIVGEFEHQDHHTLVGLPGCKLDDIEEVLVHPFSLAQILPVPQILDGKRIIIADETAKAIAEGQSKKRAAISSTRAATIYDLYTFDEFEVIGVTRYILVSKKEATPERYLSPRTTLKLSMKNQVGALMKTTCAFAHRNLNIAKLESRPLAKSIRSQTPWEYVVYVDVDCGLGDSRMDQAIANLREFASVTVFGSYPRYLRPLEPVNFTYGN